MYFKHKTDDGIVNPEFSENEELSLVTLALVLTVVRSPLQLFIPPSHTTATRSRIASMSGKQENMSMSSSQLRPTRTSSLRTSNDLRTSARRPRMLTLFLVCVCICSKWRSNFFISVLVQVLMRVFRKHAKADDAPQAIQAARITEDEVEAAKKEWEGLVLSEDED